ncbi:CDP-alcohol phosphatidyltransferase family protein [Sphingomonas sp. Leaf242]|uniref:CDP-alcohol phosphatidyltransferase family protein n=1 Tax=Sphingomonas sp. Leaf242 TaxID=1736304 RepID=UPI00071265C0|nr:CDP-alcohol phosphatidyltransferase family protein [Sphingomonas sp. Leaf242]KQO09069.1 CDP-alcohol phosphatidyltransferase [Sphingomonas sp. Leaf242]
MSHNTIIHRIVRPAVRIAARTAITPNQITTVRLVSGIAAAVCLAEGTYGWMAIGGVVFVVSMLLDRADGELARQTGQMSVWGYRYDLASDCIASVATFVGLGIGLAATHGTAALWLGILAGVGIGTLFAELNVLNFADVRGYELSAGFTVDPDDAMILVPVLIWLGLAWPMTIAAAVITPSAAIILALLALRRRR